MLYPCHILWHSILSPHVVGEDKRPVSCSECLCVQALMPQQWSTVFIFFPAHWMPGMFVDHMIPCVLRMFTSLIYVYELHFMLTILLFVLFCFLFQNCDEIWA